MERSSSSDANSWSQSSKQASLGSLCHCSKPTSLVKSWTDENPGRWFHRCNVHGFCRWADEEKPHGWQKVSLVEARDQIRNLKSEMKRLKDCLGESSRGITSVDSTIVEKLEKEKKQLENEVMVSREKEKLLRQFIVLSWGGFIVVTAMILMVK